MYCRLAAEHPGVCHRLTSCRKEFAQNWASQFLSSLPKVQNFYFTDYVCLLYLVVLYSIGQDVGIRSRDGVTSDQSQASELLYTRSNRFLSNLHRLRRDKWGQLQFEILRLI